MSLLDDLNDTFRVQAGKQPLGLLDIELPSQPEQAAPNFNFSPSEQQNKQALFSSLASMGAAMLANNRGGFGQALGHGLAAQQQGYRGALDRAQEDNVQQFRTSALKDDWQEKQQERQRQAALRRALAELPQGEDYWRKAASLYASAGDMDTALKLQEYGTGGKPTDAQRNYQFLISQGVDPKQAQQVFTPFAPRPMQYFRPTENSPGGFVDTTTQQRYFDEPPLQPKLKEVPADVLKKVGENKGTLDNLDSLIADLKTEIKAGGSSVGAWNYLPGSTALGQYVDPGGIGLRANIANISGRVIHDRSGATVTIGETARLKPFLPDETDSPGTALKKAVALRKALGDEMQAYNSMFGPDYGYKGLTPQSGGSVPAPSGQPARQTAPSSGGGASPKQGNQPNSKYVNLNGKNVMAQLDPSNGKYYVNQGGRWMEVK